MTFSVNVAESSLESLSTERSSFPQSLEHQWGNAGEKGLRCTRCYEWLSEVRDPVCRRNDLPLSTTKDPPATAFSTTGTLASSVLVPVTQKTEPKTKKKIGVAGPLFQTREIATQAAQTKGGIFKSKPGHLYGYHCFSEGCTVYREVHEVKDDPSCWSYTEFNGPCTHPLDLTALKKLPILFPEEVCKRIESLRTESAIDILTKLRQEFPTEPSVKVATPKRLHNWRWRKLSASKNATIHSLKAVLNEIFKTDASGENVEEPFLIGQEIRPDGSHFHINLSSPKLLENSKRGFGDRLVLLDGTFRVVREGFCILLLVTTDIAHHALPLSLSITTGERAESAFCLLKDTKMWIEKLFKIVWIPLYGLCDHSSPFIKALKQFGISKVVDCYFHVRSTIKRKYAQLGAEHYKVIMKDVSVLALLPDATSFAQLKMIAFQKWQQLQVSPKFLSAWESTYLKSEWNYSALPDGMPNTNAPTEGLNNTIKTWLKRQQKQLLVAIPRIKELVSSWSMLKTTAVERLYPNLR